jgi:hypothetical protein
MCTALIAGFAMVVLVESTFGTTTKATTTTTKQLRTNNDAAAAAACLSLRCDESI